uniref:Tryptophyllin-T3-3 n=1 Tax=Phasmahyla jandaia TaxID=762504 RepID=TY33_PHAJA|nr:RecName: Full=Tryptophyllin-T3-3; Short=Pj-T3-3 [Phasmahyla jandaia]
QDKPFWDPPIYPV